MIFGDSSNAESETARKRPAHRNPWSWVPSLYLAEGLPYVVVMTVSVIMYKGLGISNTEIALYTSWLYLPWVIKPLWSPLVDLLKTRRLWIWTMQLIVGAGLAGVALTLQAPKPFQYSLAFLCLLAFSSATHDIAADGFYMLATTQKEQAFFVGIRSTFYRIAMISAQGLLVILAGSLEQPLGVQVAWGICFAVLAALFLGFAVYHRFVLPHPGADQPGAPGSMERFFVEFLRTFAEFFRKPRIGVLLLFLLFYRFGEAQLVKMVSPFLLDAREKGGLGLSTKQVGIAYGTIGVIALLLGGIIGGILVSRDGLKKWLWPMVCVMHLPDAMFVYLAYAQPTHFWTVSACVAIEQFGYGFGFAAYMLYMIYIARGQHQTAHYAICTGFMAMGMMFPGMWSGWLQKMNGYQHFFIWVLLATIPSFLIVAFVPLDAEFGKKAECKT